MNHTFPYITFYLQKLVNLLLWSYSCEVIFFTIDLLIYFVCKFFNDSSKVEDDNDGSC